MRRHGENKDWFAGTTLGASLVVLGIITLAIFFAGGRLAGAKSVPNQAQKPELVVQTGHSSKVTALAYSPDGRLLASGSEDKTVKIWEASTGREIRTLYGHTWKVTAVAFSPDSQMLASASWDRTVRIWNVRTGKELIRLEGHTDLVTAICFSRDGSVLASIADDKTVRIWETATGKQIQLIETEKFPVDQLIESISGKALAFSPTADVLAFGAADGRSVILYDYKASKSIRRILPTTNYRAYLQTIVFTPDGKRLITGSQGQIGIWDAVTGAKLSELPSSQDFGGLWSVAVGGKGKLLAGVASDRGGVWNLVTGQKINEFKVPTGGRQYSVALSPDGKTVVTGGDDPERIQLWSVASGKRRKSFEGYINAQIDSPWKDDGRRFWSLKNIARSWNFDDGSPLRALITLAS